MAALFRERCSEEQRRRTGPAHRHVLQRKLDSELEALNQARQGHDSAAAVTPKAPPDSTGGHVMGKVSNAVGS